MPGIWITFLNRAPSNATKCSPLYKTVPSYHWSCGDTYELLAQKLNCCLHCLKHRLKWAESEVNICEKRQSHQAWVSSLFIVILHKRTPLSASDFHHATVLHMAANIAEQNAAASLTSRSGSPRRRANLKLWNILLYVFFNHTWVAIRQIYPLSLWRSTTLPNPEVKKNIKKQCLIVTTCLGNIFIISLFFMPLGFVFLIFCAVKSSFQLGIGKFRLNMVD
jgi:hypothetical protein